MKQPLLSRGCSEMPRRILYLGGFELPDRNAAAHRVLGNAKALRALGWDVVFVGIDQSGSETAGVLDTKSDVQGFARYAVPYPRTNRRWVRYLSDAAPYIAVCEAVGSVSAMILYNAPSVVMAKLMRYCRARGIVCIADSTEWYSSKGRGFAYSVLKSADTWFRMRILQKRMDGLIVISRYLERYYAALRHLVVIPPLTDSAEEKWHIAEHVPDASGLKLVYAGSPERKDRIDILIEALSRTKRPYRLDVIGMTKEEYLTVAPQHRRFVERTNEIRFHGRLSHIKALEFVQKADFSCFFREDDRVSRAGFPTKFAEAVSSGTPVITNATGDLNELLRDSRLGYRVERLSSDAIAGVFAQAARAGNVPRDLFDYHHFIEKMRAFLYGDGEY